MDRSVAERYRTMVGWVEPAVPVLVPLITGHLNSITWPGVEAKRPLL
jgi:hypothetical protein